MRTTAAPVFLYRAYDIGGRLLYVGIARDVLIRFEGHGATPWFPLIAGIDLEIFWDKRRAKVAETRAIKAEWPLWNTQQSPWSGVVREQMLRFEETRRTIPAAADEKRSRHARHVHQLIADAEVRAFHACQPDAAARLLSRGRTHRSRQAA